MEAQKKSCNGLLAFDDFEVIQVPRDYSNKECPQTFEPPTTTTTTTVTQQDTNEESISSSEFPRYFFA